MVLMKKRMKTVEATMIVKVNVKVIVKANVNVKSLIICTFLYTHEHRYIHIKQIKQNTYQVHC